MKQDSFEKGGLGKFTGLLMTQTFLVRARFYLVVFGGLYLLLILFLAVPFFQSQLRIRPTSISLV
jgi:hypothetical protein